MNQRVFTNISQGSLSVGRGLYGARRRRSLIDSYANGAKTGSFFPPLMPPHTTTEYTPPPRIGII